jgi:cyclopropane-fatty-acyl-phospholipid synthase
MAFWAKSLADESFVRISLHFLDKLFENCPRRDFQVRLWDGSMWGEEREPRFTILLRHAGALHTMFRNATELSLGEAYLYDDFGVDGDLEAAFDLGDYLLGQTRGVSRSLELAEWLRRLPAPHHDHGGAHEAHVHGFRHSRNRDRQAIRYHYDLPTEFYALWLDPQLVYSCAYFETGDESLEAAQRAKLEYLCRKLRLRRGDRLLDIGCGWGALILHAAEYHGAQAVGIMLSEAQAEGARTGGPVPRRMVGLSGSETELPVRQARKRGHV